MSYNEMIFLPQLDLLWLFRARPQGDECKFLTLLNSDVRFQIYDYLAPDRHADQIIDIFEPNKHNSAKALDALMSTSHEIRDDINLWLSQNTSWLTRTGPRGNVIQLLPTIQNTKYLLKWTSDFGCSQLPSKEVESWHQFCFHNSTQSPIGPLVVELHLPTREDALYAFEMLFAEPYRIEMGKRGAPVGPLPIAPFLTSIEIILCLDENNHGRVRRAGRRTGRRARRRARWDWDEKLGKAWAIMWHDIGPCSIVRNCGDACAGFGCTCRKRNHSTPPELSWSLLQNADRTVLQSFFTGVWGSFAP